MANDKNLISMSDTANDELLCKFFAGSAHMHVADNGFSSRVMLRLQTEMPLRQRMIYHIWTIVCVLACVLMFFLNDGIGIIKGHLHNLMGSVAAFVVDNMQGLFDMWHTPHAVFSSTPLLVIISLTVIGAVALYDMAES